MKKTVFIWLAFGFWFLPALSLKMMAQTGIEPYKLKQFNITVNHEDYTVKTQILSQNKSVKINNDRIYLWYVSQKIMETKGGFDGKLIHGIYCAFYLNNQLKEKGQISYGLKHKEWKYWYPDGKLKEVINWKNGVKNGKYYLYNDYGQLMAQSNFKGDKLDGKFYTYAANGNVIEKKCYKRGDEVPEKLKTKDSRQNEIEKKKEKALEEKVLTNPSEEKKPFFKKWFKKKKKISGPAKTKVSEKTKVITS